MASGDTGLVVVWFRRDLRIADNPALTEAVRSGRPVVALYVLDEDDPRAPGGAGRWWLHGTLAALRGALQRLGCPLVLRRGSARTIVPEVAATTGARAIHWNRCHDPHALARDRVLKAALSEQGVEARSWSGSLLFEPWEVATKAGSPYRVFTPYWRACLAAPAPRKPLPSPPSITGAPGAPEGDTLEGWALLPARPDWAGGLRDAWTPGEAGAESSFRQFMNNELQAYKIKCDFPDRSGTSALDKAGIRLGIDYPAPVVDHGAARARALETWRTHIRKGYE